MLLFAIFALNILPLRYLMNLNNIIMKTKTLLSFLLLIAAQGSWAQSVSAELMDEHFNDSVMPYGWFAKGWEVKDGVATPSSGGFDMSSLMGGGGGNDNFLMTPPLSVQEGEMLVFSAKKAKASGLGAMMGGSDSTFVVEYEIYSEHRWKKLADFTTQLDSVYKDFTISGMAAGEYRFRFKAGGTVNIDSVAGFHIDMEAPDIYVVQGKVAASNVNFGLCTQDSTTTFTVINTATGTLNTAIEIYDDMPFSLSTKELAVAAGDSLAVDLTYNYNEASQGRNTTEISFKPADPRVFGMSYRADAVVAEEGVWQEDFNTNTQPAGWFTEGWQFKDNTASIIQPSDGMEGMMGGSSPFYYLLTPVLTIQSPLQVLAFKARTTGSSGMGSMMGGGSSTFTLEKSAYGSNRWERVKDFSGKVDTVFTTLWASEMQPGDYRFRFVASDSIVIDSVAGFSMKNDAPDLYITVDSMVVNRIDFGMLKADFGKTVMVINTGNGTLQVDVTSSNPDAFTVSQSSLSIAAGDTACVDVTYLYNEALLGQKETLITFKPANDGLAAQAISFSAYTISDETWAENFEPEYIIEDESQPLDLPAGWESTGWTISKPSSGGMMEMFGGGGGVEKSWMATTESENYELITPRLQANKGDIMQFLADMSGGGGMMSMMGMGGGGSGRLDVYYSREDYNDWTLYGTYTQTGMVAFKAPYSGIYRLKFKGRDVALDDFKGFQYPIQSISLVDSMTEQNLEVLEVCNKQKRNVSYDRLLSAEVNGDGSWTPKAYTICLPYDMNFRDYYEAGKVKLYQLKYIDRYYHHFIFAEATETASSGVAYLAVVNDGSVKLNAYGVEVTNEIKTDSDALPIVYDYEEWYFNNVNDSVGSWLGSFSQQMPDEEDASLKYCLTDDGSWARLSSASGNLPGFRGYFYATSNTLPDNFNPSYARAKAPAKDAGIDYTYQTKFYQNKDNMGDDAATPLMLFNGDISLSESNTTDISPVIQTIDSDGTNRYYDLQGRMLQGKPQRGIYIENGIKKVR